MTSSSPGSSKSFNESIPKHAYFIKSERSASDQQSTAPINGCYKCSKISLHLNMRFTLEFYLSSSFHNRKDVGRLSRSTNKIFLRCMQFFFYLLMMAIH